MAWNFAYDHLVNGKTDDNKGLGCLSLSSSTLDCEALHRFRGQRRQLSSRVWLLLFVVSDRELFGTL